MRSFRGTISILAGCLSVLSGLWLDGSAANSRLCRIHYDSCYADCHWGGLRGVFYNHLNQYYRAHPNARKVTGIRYVLRTLWKPLTMAAFTTIVGFISLLTSQVYPIKYFGTFTAFGIFVAFALALVFLPAMVMITGYKVKEKHIDAKPVDIGKTHKLAELFLKNKKAIIITTLVIAVVSIFGITRVWINSSFLDNFERDHDIVLTDSFVNSKFGGTSTLNVILESETFDAFKQPEALRLMDQMQTETEKMGRVGNSFSLADYLKRMNKVMNEDQEAFYSIPDNSDLIASICCFTRCQEIRKIL